MGKEQFYTQSIETSEADALYPSPGSRAFVPGLTIRPPGMVVVFGDANHTVDKPAGRKDDTGKVRMELMNDLPRAIEGVAKVLTWAVTQKQPPYEPGSWLNVDNFFNRYQGAMLRHQTSMNKQGRYSVDKETQLLEAFHIATNAMFLAEKLARELEDLNRTTG